MPQHITAEHGLTTLIRRMAKNTLVLRMGNKDCGRDGLVTSALDMAIQMN
jgi:hypothetical protein